ncbi:DUF4175 family protein [Bacteroidota bacterium]
MDSYKSKYRELTDKLRTTRRKETLIQFFTGLFNVCSIILISIIFLSLIELVAAGDISFRTVLAFLILTVLASSFLFFVLPSILRAAGVKNKPTLEAVALRVGSFYPELKDNICNIIQLVKKIELKKEQRPDNTSKTLALAAFDNISADALTKDFNIVIEKKEFKKSFWYFMFSTILTVILFLLFQSSLGASFYRIVNFNKSYIPPAPFSLSIEPKEVSMLRGSKALINVISTGKSPERITLMLKEEQQESYDEYVLTPDSTGYFSFEIAALKKTISYFARADWLNTSVVSDTGRIMIIERPFIRSFYGNIIYPKYTKLSRRKIDEQNADITALIGSRVELSILANKSLKSADIVLELNKKTHEFDSLQRTGDWGSGFGVREAETQNPIPETRKGGDDSLIVNSQIDTIKYAMTVKNNKAFGSFNIKGSGSYYLKIYDVANEENVDPIKYSLIALSDDYPTISLIEPLVDVQVTEEALLPIRTAIADDYGFTGLRLNYRLVQSRYSQPMKEFKHIKIPVISDELAVEIPFIWDLNEVDISPDDIYEYYLEVFDNDIIGGPKSSRTQTLMVKLPSLDEVLGEVDKEQEKIEKELRDILKKAANVRKDLQELNKELLKKQNAKDINWKDRKKAEDIINRQEEMKQKLSDIQQSLEKMTESLKQKNAISEETIQKYLELQKLMSEVNSPELQRMQQNLKDALDQATLEQKQEAMKKVKFDEEKFRKSIERTMNILKRLKAEQKADAIKKQADELNEKLEDLEKQMDNTNSSDKQKMDELAKKQEKLQEDFKKMADELKELEKLMKELEDMPMDELESAKDALNENETGKEMKDAKESMKNGELSKAKKSGKKAKSNLKKFSQQMKKMKDKMQEKGIKEAMRQMQKAISDMLKLSEDQEKVKDKTRATDYNSTQFNELLNEQAMINQALTNSINNMTELAQKSFAVTPQMGKQLGDALRSMDNALKQLSERNTSQASKSQSNSMSSMNQAVMGMQAMLSRMQQSNSCSSPNGTGEGQEGESGSGQTPSMSGENFMNQLQQLANEQQGINSMMQQLGQKGSMSPEEQAQLSRMTAEQGHIQKSVEQLAEEQRKSMRRDGKKLGLGNLDKIAEEMKEAISEMKQGRIRQQTLKRQERILSRLLDASRSIHERDKESRRESETGFERKRNSPSQFDMNSQEGKRKALQELLKSIQQGYTKDYEALIRRYFEALQSQESGIE